MKSLEAECDACKKLNGQVVDELCPPLHGGCQCTVRRQREDEIAAKTLQSSPESVKMKSDEEIYAWISSDECNKSINEGQQRKHYKGTHENEQYVERLAGKGQFGPSRMTINCEELSEIVKQYAGTGELKRSNRLGNWIFAELVDCHHTVGIVVNNITGTEAETTMMKIHYGGSGIHCVPAYPTQKGG